MDKEEKAKEVLETIIKLIWGFSVNVEAKKTGRGIYLYITEKSPNILRYLIGKRGRNIIALRRLMDIWGYLNDTMVFIASLKGENEKEKI